MRRIVLARSVGTLALLACLAPSGANAARAGRSKLAPDLEELAAAGPGSRRVDVIIQVEGGGSALGGLRRRVHAMGAEAGSDLRLVDGLAATISVADLAVMADDPAVLRVAPDRPVVPAMDVAAPASGAGWTRSLSPTAGPTGQDVLVAVIDSGVYPHEDLGAAGVVASLDFVDPRRRANEHSADPFGHGTHIAGIIAGRPSASPLDGGAVLGGVAPGARLLSLRVLDHRGMGRASEVIAALSWCVDNKDRLGIRIVNMSIGQPVGEPAATDPLVQAVERAWTSGLVVVASAGNNGMVASGFGTISSPGNSARVITVGAVDDLDTAGVADDVVAGFSSKGPTRFDLTLKPDLVAPGVNVVSLRSPLSTLDRMLPGARVAAGGSRGPAFEARYFEMSGSSMATALVSGAAALLLEADPTLTPDDVKARLMRHARHDLAHDLLTRGAGAVDAAAALAAGGRAVDASSPTVLAGEGSLALEGAGGAWGDPEAWAVDLVYGEPSTWGAQDPPVLDAVTDPCITGEGLSWQTITGEGLSWQTIHGSGLSWQTLTASGLSWQTMTSSGLSWQTLGGQGLSWQTFRGYGLSWQTSTAGGVCPY